jgi:uncharacterized protein (TIGR02118 family)
MIKLFGPMTRLDLVPRAEFQDYYVNQHTKVGGNMPRMLKYVGSPALQSGNGDDPAFDAVMEGWWPDVDSVRNDFVTPEWNTARTDHPAVVSGRFMWLAEEHEIQNVPDDADPVKYLAFLNRADGQSRQEFELYWLERHVPLVLKTPGLLGYRASVSIGSANGDSLAKDVLDDAPFDGVAEVWFESLAAFSRSFRDPYWNQIRSDYYQNFAMNRIQVVVKEHVIFDRTKDQVIDTRSVTT